MPSRLTNKTAIITGSSSGIGRATALLFAREGANIVCSDIRDLPRAGGFNDGETSTVDEIKAVVGNDNKVMFVKCDTRSKDDVENLIKETVGRWGRVDIMVNNAGIGELTPVPIYDYPEDGFTNCLDVNVKGVFLGTKYAARQMRAQEPLPGVRNGDKGWIVNLASIVGVGGQGNAVAYVASKHAVMGITKTAAWDLAPDLIHVNAVCPGYTRTSMTQEALGNDEIARVLEPMHPFRGFGEPEDIARAALFLASEDASWVTGHGLAVDGGYLSR
ncbi:putative short chain type dehydrogenase [Periconia macrospinosa]|uniref:Putative short chain type dehydrogenase n=1 Tax=Periconia macrospinosa TaxID=97972 RepID=A0A2V1DG52_9PLEO|nr:putative short chain type dehydrogenase [Periconia macrospinosa]